MSDPCPNCSSDDEDYPVCYICHGSGYINEHPVFAAIRLILSVGIFRHEFTPYLKSMEELEKYCKENREIIIHKINGED